MANEKSLDNAFKFADMLIDSNKSGNYYLYLNWTNSFITIHGETSHALKKNIKHVPRDPYCTFGKTENGYWFGHFNSYLEAVGYAKLLSDIHHRQTGGYFLISNSYGVDDSAIKPF